MQTAIGRMSVPKRMCRYTRNFLLLMRTLDTTMYVQPGLVCGPHDDDDKR